MERVLGEDTEVLERMTGAQLAGIAYEPPFPYISDYGPRGHTVLTADFVTTEDGTGVVHTAIAFGEDDFRLGEQYGIKVQNPVRPDGTFDERIEPFAGRFVKDADPDIVEALRVSGRLFRAEEYQHAYPHCWRCGTPLLYYAKTNWFVRTTEVRDRLLAANEEVTWYPHHVKHGRFGNWLESNVDWAPRGSATGARRCRSGAARRATCSAPGRWPTWRSAAVRCPRTCTGRSSTMRS